MDSRTVRAKHKEFLFPCVANYYEEPLVIAEGHGARVRDAEGREYLDFFGGILTLGVGHSHPEIVRTLQTQLERLTHTSTVYPTAELVRVAERLARITPGKLKKSFFTTSGTEADETAILLAKIYTGQQEIIALRHSYAGRSLTAIAITGQQPWRVLPTQVPGIKHALSPYCYRCPLGLEYPSCGVKCAQDLEELIRTETTGRPAAFIAEPIQGAGGFIVPPKEYFQIAVGIVRSHGGVFICDEVQTGWGRTGGHWCGIEHWGVEPEIMTFAKAIASGFPVGATIATPEVADAFTGLSLSTFGGNAISMAAVDATLDVMEREDTPLRSAERGAQLRAALDRFKEEHPFIGDVRGMGLMQGLELVEDRKTKEPAPKKTVQLLEAAKGQGLLIGKGGLYGNVIRIAPSMLITADEVDDGCARLGRALAEVGR
jgi:alanine-glyoxylate transaminase / (R)-3-amino-2-methylpropionate-pyruvate transaminase